MWLAGNRGAPKALQNNFAILTSSSIIAVSKATSKAKRLDVLTWRDSHTPTINNYN